MKPCCQAPRALVSMLMMGLATAALGGFPSHAEAAPARGKAGKADKPDKASKDFTYTVSDCLESGRNDSADLVVSDDAVSFNHVLTLNCTAATHPATVKVLYTKKGRNLEVDVVLRSPVLADCTCPIGIEGKISNLGKGTYRLSFVHEVKVGDSSDKPTRQNLGGQEFTIN